GPGAVSKSYGYAETNNYVKKVTGNYNSYLKKATGSVAKVSNSASKKIETLTVKSTKSTKRKLAGWGGQITSGYGTYRGNTGTHFGIDIAGKRGQKVEANANGKVTFAGKGVGNSASYGNYIKIKGKGGKEYLYAHLDSVNVKKGQKVKVGQKLGAIGNTGTVQTVGNKKTGAGSHLHYEEWINGKRIDPKKGLAKAKGKHKITSGGYASTKGVVDKSKQAIDDAKSDNRNRKKEIDAQTEKELTLRKDKIDSFIAGYEYDRSKNENKINKEKAKQERSNGQSDWYRKSIDKEIKATKDNKNITKREMAYIERRLADPTLKDPDYKDQLKSQLKDLGLSLESYTTELKNLEAEKVNSKVEQYESKKSRKDEAINLQSAKQDLMNQTSSAYTKSLDKQVKYNREKKRLIEDELSFVNSQLKNKDLTQEAISELKTKANELKVDLQSLNKEIVNLRKTKIDAKLAKNDEKISDYEYLKSRSEIYASTLTEGDKGLVEHMSKQIDYMNKIKQEMAKDNVILLKTLSRSDLTAEEKKEYKRQIQDNKNAMLQIQADIKNMYKDTADYAISLMKELYEKQRYLAL
ncbi:peptidoglycan DD-metalloendopeptidase family protein, partial [Streptomyces sp. NPDC057927]